MNGVKTKGTMKMNIKNKLSNLAWSRLRNRGLLVAVGAAALLAAACADDDLANDKPNKHMGTTLAFNVSDMQMDALAQNGAGQTRGLSMQPIPASYLAPRKIDATGSNPHDFCLIESTVEGLNPVKPDAKTRGTILTAGTLGTFSSIGYRAASPTAAAQPSTALLWFHGEKTNPDGTLQNRYDWDWPVNVYGRFYAVSPEATAANGITLSPSNYAQVPYIDFEVKSNVIDQVDLMTACSGEVHYEHGNDPTSNLKFTHALAAVKFSIGSNLSPVTIKKIDVSGVKYKGRYKLPNKADGSDAAWISVDNATTTMTLDNINVNAAEMPNTMLAGALNPAANPNNRHGRDAYTFLMIPQTLPNKSDGNHAKVTIYYQDGPTTKHVSFPLCEKDGSGSVWKANTTKEYKLSQKNSSWGYHFTLDGNLTFNYNETAAKPFKVESWREGGTDPVTGLIAKQAIPWKVVKYEEWDYTANGGAGDWIDKGTTKPDWLNNVQTEGNGAAGSAESVNASVKNATMIDKLAIYNKVLKDATPKGTASNPYNLANPSGNGAVNTIEESANSYLISAPGHYCIPLVYGNAVKFDEPSGNNKKAYISSAPARNILIGAVSQDVVLHTFFDHNNQPIQSPYINVQNNTDKATKARIVWSDQKDLIEIGNNPIKSYNGVDFVEFEVKAANICNGNAVIAVANSSGTIMWSWHLWFDHKEALDKIRCTNFQNKNYAFTRRTLGAAIYNWKATSYDQPRKVRLTIEQQFGNGHLKKNSNLVITQNTNEERTDIATLYQFGRKDALPGTNLIKNGSFTMVNGAQTIGSTIQNPDKIFYYNSYPYNFLNYTYWNLWSTNDAGGGTPYNDSPVIKTIYDPCPAGFKMPNSQVFTGFTSNGQNKTGEADINKIGDFNKGIYFKTSPSSTNTVYFPATGYRDYASGKLQAVGEIGYYWPATAFNEGRGCGMLIKAWDVAPLANNIRCGGYAVRPVAESRTKVKPKVPGSTEEGWEDGGDLDGGEYEL